MQVLQEPADPLTQDEFTVGDVVTYRDACGNERTITVTEKRDDVNNGHAGILGRLIRGDPVDAAPPPGTGVWSVNATLETVIENPVVSSPTTPGFYTGNHITDADRND